MDPMRKLNNQIESTFKRAFYDLLAERISHDPPDYEWLCRLYNEIRGKLLGLVNRRCPLREEIETSLDVELFNQMIRNKAFDPDDLYRHVAFIFNKCKQLGAPARDGETEAKKQELLALMRKGGGEFAVVVPLFIRHANVCIDRIYEDIANLRSSR